jgi:hypothetical protein
MPLEYPLEELGHENFEKLCVALSRSFAGPAVTVFGKGPDGGREATFDGAITWSGTQGEAEDWRGHTVFQVKHRALNSTDPAENYRWLQTEIKTELDAWEKLDSRRRVKFPDYIIFMTNARLSSVAESGGIDQIEQYIRRRYDGGLKALGLKDWRVWHRDWVVNELNGNADVRAAFPGLLTAGDILARLSTILPPVDADGKRRFFVECEAQSLRFDRWVNFAEAGGEDRTSVDKVIIDLPALTSARQRIAILRFLVRTSDQCLRKTLCPSDQVRHVVITGAPGNGKSTLTKYLVQLYRSCFTESDLKGGMLGEIISATEASRKRIAIQRPNNLRWPLWVSLTELADSTSSTVFHFLSWAASTLSARAGEQITAGWLRSWLQTWPALIVFDGLDEVTAPDARQRVLDIIENFRDEVDRLDGDVLIVVTTRPSGYTPGDQLTSNEFQRLDLDYLDASEALNYATHVTNLRLWDDPDRAGVVLQKLKQAVVDEVAINLTRTPLQVLIMTIILERFGSLPTDRYQLFWRYFETIYTREASKPTEFAQILTDNRDTITTIHTRVGLELQHKSETEGEAGALLSLGRLEQHTRDYLIQELEFQDNIVLTNLVREIRDAAMTRLVLLVAKGAHVGFEVRPLQELMASRALGDCEDTVLRRRMNALAPSPHWRNTLLLMAGRIYSEPHQHRWNLVAELVTTVDLVGDWPGWLCPVGPGLAAQLLEEGIAHNKPRWRNQILDVALRGLTTPVVVDLEGVRRGLIAAAHEPQALERIRGAMDAKGGGPSIDKSIAIAFWSTNQFGGQIRGWTRVESSEVDWGGVGRKSATGLSKLLGPKRGMLGSDSSWLELVRELGQLPVCEMSDGQIVPVSEYNSGLGWDRTLRALFDSDLSGRLRTLLDALGADQWAAKYTIARAIEQKLTRHSVAASVLADWLDSG